MKNTHNWHDKSSEQTLSELKTAHLGLSEADANQRLITFGPNKLPEPMRRNILLRFFHHFHNILIYVLLGAATITALLGHVVDTFVIIAVVVINAVIGFLQEGKAEKAMEAIRHMLALRASVIREGRRQTVKAEQLVPGDIVLLDAGDKLPADLRLLKTHGLQIQESILTGESMAVDKNSKQVATDAALGDRFCIGYSGTTVTRGQGMGVVVATGLQTEIGRISGLLSEVQTLNTPLVVQMAVFARWLTLFIIGIAALILLLGYFVLHHDFANLFMAVVGIAVAAIPEGLPAVLTITLAVGVQVMARRNAIVRRLPAIETLGSVSVICSDKTGTLTRNEMIVTTIVTSLEHFNIHGTGYEPLGDISINDRPVSVTEHAVLQELGRVAALCNDSELIKKEGTWTGLGDPMESALLAFSNKAGIDGSEIRNQWTRTDVIPFDTKHKYMATLNHDHENHAFIFIKGAPETIFTMCREQHTGSNETKPLDIAYWNEQANKIAAQGQRVLAFATKEVKPEHTVLEQVEIKDSLVLLGLAGFIDPPRQEAMEA
ncbi:MAG: HAD-IC family P-type ATPase, partial [Gammaproteobacteria bacterium]|nr:HAD-IC family P-type ATPase [Gammaproteobacteria bacterium]